MSILRRFLTCALLACFLTTVATAAPTPEQRKELQAITREASSVSSLLRRKQYEEAETKLEELLAKANKIIEAGELEGDRTAAATLRAINGKRQAVAKALGKPDPTLISFSREIAPILDARCGNCHSATRASGRLDLSTFAGMRRGGMNGPLLVPKSPQRSLLVFRLTTPNQQMRMPRNGNPLERNELSKIYTWIEQGAPFDGEDPTLTMAELAKAAENDGSKPMPLEPVEIAKATGNETVSFVRDVAPTFVNLCTGCHGANNPRSGFSLLTFEALMRGGDSGRVIVPGNLDGSRLWQLVGVDGVTPRMPQGQGRITRKFHADLRKWIEEGAKFDGDDAKATLRSLVPTEDEMAMEKLAALTPEQFKEHRLTRTEEQFKRVAPRARGRYVATDEFLVYGDASEERLKQVSEWAELHAGRLRETFGINQKPIWKGRLAIFVMRDRYGYTEFNQVIHQRGTGREVHSHSQVTAGFDDAFAAVEDVGDEPSDSHGGLQLTVQDAITEAWLRQPGNNLPEWLIRGTSLTLAAQGSQDNSYVTELTPRAIGALEGIAPGEIFNNGRFGPSEVGPVGYTLVSFMLKNGGVQKFGRFVGQIRGGASVAAAVRAVYPPADLNALGTAYLQSLGGSSKRK
ncbi:MAG: c-type cytochrome domain-containing protein [Planctomycetota bacterium]